MKYLPYLLLSCLLGCAKPLRVAPVVPCPASIRPPDCTHQTLDGYIWLDSKGAPCDMPEPYAYPRTVPMNIQGDLCECPKYYGFSGECEIEDGKPLGMCVYLYWESEHVNCVGCDPAKEPK